MSSCRRERCVWGRNRLRKPDKERGGRFHFPSTKGYLTIVKCPCLSVENRPFSHVIPTRLPFLGVRSRIPVPDVRQRTYHGCQKNRHITENGDTYTCRYYNSFIETKILQNRKGREKGHTTDFVFSQKKSGPSKHLNQTFHLPP